MPVGGPQQGLTNRPRTKWEHYAYCSTCEAGAKVPCMDRRLAEKQQAKSVRSRPHKGRPHLVKD